MTTSLDSISPRLAKAILDRMGETGQPPERGAPIVNVGTEEILQTLRHEYLVPMRDSGRVSSFKLVQAPFGGGKSQFLRCLREIGWDIGFATALVGVSTKECPFDDQVRVYQSVARNLESPPDDSEGLPERGIDNVLRRAVETRVQKHGADTVRKWLNEDIARANVQSTAVRRAVVGFMNAVLDANPKNQDLLGDWLRGENVARAEVAPWQIREELESATGYRFLQSLVQVLRTLGSSGVILLFDELDRAMSLSPNRKKAVCENIRQMIDTCGTADLPSALVVYAVPPEFMSTIVPTYAALAQRLQMSGEFSAVTPMAPIIDLDHLKLTHAQLFEALGTRLLAIHAIAHPKLLDPTLQQNHVKRLSAMMARNVIEAGSRRPFVKAMLKLFELQMRQGQQPLDDHSLRRVMTDAGREAPPTMPGEETIR